MGMQCHFNKTDLPASAVVEGTYDVCWLITAYGETITVNGIYNDSSSFWFDVGSRSRDQMRILSTLIAWRVCFQCS